MALRDRQTILDDLAEGVIVADATTGEIRTVNDACCEMLGHDESVLVGSDLARLTAGGTVPVSGEGSHYERARADGDASFVWRIETAGGETASVEATLTTRRDDPDTAVLTLRERSGRQRGGPRFERQRTRYRTLFENEDLVLWEQDFSEARAYAERLADSGEELGAVIDDDPEQLLELLARMDVHRVNDAALDFYGVESEAELVANFDRMMVPETREGLTAMWQAIVEGERYFCTECKFRPLDGDDVRYELMEVYVPEQHADDYSLVFTTATDITDQKRREHDLADAKARYRRILDRSSDYVLVCTEGGTIDYVSPGVESTLGHEPAELVGTDAFEYVHPDDRNDVRGAFREMLADPEAGATVEYRVRAADGSYRWVEARGGNYLDDPLIDGVMVTIRDVVDRKRFEQELVAERDARSTLQRELARDTSTATFASAVCAELVEMDTIASARVGTVTSTDEVEVLASAGRGRAGPDAGVDLHAVRAGVADGEVRLIEAATGSGADGTDTRGVAVPITHDGVVRGVLVVRLAEPGTEPDHAEGLVAESADALGYAMTSDERRQALAADEWVQLTVRVGTTATPLSRAVEASGSTARVATAVARRDGTTLCYLEVTGDPAAFVRATRECEGVERVERVDTDGDGDASTVQAVVAGPVPSAIVAAHGGSVDEATVTAEETTVTVRIPQGEAFDPVLDALTDRFDDVARGEFTTAPTKTGADGDPLSGLTDRQRHVLEVAHRAGYFDEPRTQNAGEVADSLGVSRPAFSEVLRAAHRNLLGDLFDPT